jgi:hypothetical protein
VAIFILLESVFLPRVFRNAAERQVFSFRRATILAFRRATCARSLAPCARNASLSAGCFVNPLCSALSARCSRRRTSSSAGSWFAMSLAGVDSLVARSLAAASGQRRIADATSCTDEPAARRSRLFLFRASVGAVALRARGNRRDMDGDGPEVHRQGSEPWELVATEAQAAV